MSQPSHSSITIVLFPCHSHPIPVPLQSYSHVTATPFQYHYSPIPMSQQSCSDERKQAIVFLFVLRVPGFLDSDEAPLLERLIEAYRERDSEALEQCCNNAVFRSMDTEVLAQSYTPPLASYPGSFQCVVYLTTRLIKLTSFWWQY